MRAWRRLALVYLGLLCLSMVATRFQLVAPPSVSSGVLPITRLFGGAADNLRRAYETLTQQRTLAQSVRELRLQNATLRGRNDVLERENARLRQAAQIRATQSPNLVAVASVVEVDPSPLLSRLTINRGDGDGVRRFMPATVPDGLVGQVTGVDGRNAVITTILDPESYVGVTLKGKGGRGLAVGAPPDRLRASFPLGVNVRPGDTVLTSNLGGVYPVGIKVGTVEKVEPAGPNDVNRVAVVKPAADVNTVEEVGLLGGIP